MSKTSTLLSVVFFLFIAGCSRNDNSNNNNNNNNDPNYTNALNDFIFDGTINGTAKVIKASAGGYPLSDYNGLDPNTGITYGISIGYLSTNEGVEADMGVFTSLNDLDTTAWKTFYAINRTFSLANGANPGAKFSYADAGGVGYSTEYGSQAGSTFKIDDMQLVAHPSDPYNKVMKIKVSVNCKVYDDNGLNPKTIVGYLSGAFDYYP